MSESLSTTPTAETAPTPNGGRRALGPAGAWWYFGPAFVASVAYMDPGHFATHIQAGARFGYSLLWVVLIANLIAMLFQALDAEPAYLHQVFGQPEDVKPPDGVRHELGQREAPGLAIAYAAHARQRGMQSVTPAQRAQLVDQTERQHAVARERNSWTQRSEAAARQLETQQQRLAEIAREIEDRLAYPGQVKVTVIRESRSVDVARNHAAVPVPANEPGADDSPIQAA